MAYPVRFERSALRPEAFGEHFAFVAVVPGRMWPMNSSCSSNMTWWPMPFAEPVRSWSCLLFHRLPLGMTGIIAINLNILFPTIVGLRPRRIDNKEELNRNALVFIFRDDLTRSWISDIAICSQLLPTRYAWQCGLMPCCVTSLSMICEPMKRYLRNLVIRNTSTGGLMIILVEAEIGRNQRPSSGICSRPPGDHFCSIMPSTQLNDAMYDLEMVHAGGGNHSRRNRRNQHNISAPNHFFRPTHIRQLSCTDGSWAWQTCRRMMVYDPIPTGKYRTAGCRVL